MLNSKTKINKNFSLFVFNTILLFVVLSPSFLAYAQSLPPPNTIPATAINQTSATLNGSYTANIYDKIYFKYGEEQNNLNNKTTETTPETSSGGGITMIIYEKTITGLTSVKKYYFAFCGKKNAQEVCGETLDFTTTENGNNPGGGPASIVGSVDIPNESINSSQAKFIGAINPGGVNTTTWFEFGTNQNNISKIEASSKEIINNLLIIQNVEYLKTGLESSTTYYVRICAQNNKNTAPVCSTTESFQTKNFTILPVPGVGGSVNSKTTYTPLAPLPGLENSGCVDNGKPCIDTQKSDTNPCPFGNYLNIMFKLFLGVAGVLAVVMIVMGGVQYMTSDLVSSKEEGKKTITNAIFGLLVGLGAVLILNTINPNLLDVCLNNLPKATIVIDDSVPQTAINGKYCTGTTGGPYAAGADWATIAGNQTTLPANITTNNGECAKVGDQNCTSLRGLSLNIINTITTNCSNCGNLVVTGGTECWLHGGASQSTTHRPDSPSTDLRIGSNPSLDAYIKSGTKNKSWYKKDGISYLLESNHWHAQQ
jgi:hypothetical protein